MHTDLLLSVASVVKTRAPEVRMHGPAPAPINPEDLLQRWLVEHDVKRAGELLETLMFHAEQTVRRIVEFRLWRGAYDARRGTSIDVDDVCNTALANLLAGLARMKCSNDAPIENFSDYTATIAFNACGDYFRKRQPERYSLANQLRYLLRHTPGLALWKTRSDIEMCGDAALQGIDRVSPPGSLREVLQGSRRLSADLLFSVFRVVAAPLEFEVFVNELADVLGIRTRFTDDDDHNLLVNSEPSIEEQLCARQFLRRLWTAICRLPVQQRRALLLNMKDSYEGDIGVFDWFGVATVQQIAEAVEIPAEQFAELWQELPITDKRIAKLCGIGIQDVINRRSSARKTLKKHVKDV